MYDIYIFDIDDTLVQTEQYHYQAWKTVLLNFHCDLSPDIFFRTFHALENETSIPHYIDSLPIEVSYKELREMKKKEFIRILSSTVVQMTPGAESFLHRILDQNKQFVLVTNSTEEILSLYVEQFPILSRALRHYTQETHILPKPHPECYMRVLDDFPNHTKVVFEDSLVGIHSAYHACSPYKIPVYFVNREEYFYKEYIASHYSVTHIPDFTLFDDDSSSEKM